jgi:hypothetical protein
MTIIQLILNLAVLAVILGVYFIMLWYRKHRHVRNFFEDMTEEEKADVIFGTRKYDLTEKFQRAINENTTFILPKGRYRVDGPITLKDKK